MQQISLKIPEDGLWVWQSKNRYYSVQLNKGLFGEWTVTQSWGGINSKLGNCKVFSFISVDDALEHIESVRKVRERRRYKAYRRF